MGCEIQREFSWLYYKRSDLMAFQCKICSNTTDFKVYHFREMQLGLRDDFAYHFCNHCQALQIDKIPEDLDKYYPRDQYYSFSSTNNKIISFFSGLISKYSFNQKGMGYKLIDHYGLSDYSLAAVGKLNPPKTWRVLDVGSGAGQLLIILKKLGYTNLTGIDPYAIPSIYPVNIRNIHLADLPENEMFDLIMFHHSFEHTPDPIETLLFAKRHLSKGGIILIRTPLISYAFENYGENWFQLDAPRHLHLQSLKSIPLMLEKAGLKLNDLYCDSRDEQFYVSENYVKNISMKESKRGPLKAMFHVLFSPKRKRYRKEAKKLNAQLMGDSVAYYVTNESINP